MRTITKKKLTDLAKMQDPESELYEMSYCEIQTIKEKIEGDSSSRE